jgi:hypothetical protein
VIKITKESYRLSKPTHAPDPVWSMMEKCWASEPQQRPLWKEIYHHLKVFPHESLISSGDFSLSATQQVDVSAYSINSKEEEKKSDEKDKASYGHEKMI